MDKIPVSALLSDEAAGLRLKLVYGKHKVKEKFISNFRIQKPGLGLAGYTEHIHSGRVQILGNTEISYLRQIGYEKGREVTFKLCERNITCFVVTKNLGVPKAVLEAVRKFEIPLFKTELVSSEAITELMTFMEDRLAPEKTVHGVMMDVFGVGILIHGRSGIGKSECAVELIKRGHRLVADDAVIFKQKQDYVVGASSDILRNHMEVRGLGILNIRDMFGVTAIRLRKKLELVIKFVDWNEDTEFDRIGLEENHFELLGQQIPLIVLPITAGRNMAVIVEIAARNQLLKIMGYDPAKRFNETLMKTMAADKYDTNEADSVLLKILRNRGVE